MKRFDHFSLLELEAIGKKIPRWNIWYTYCMLFIFIEQWIHQWNCGFITFTHQESYLCKFRPSFMVGFLKSRYLIKRTWLFKKLKVKGYFIECIHLSISTFETMESTGLGISLEHLFKLIQSMGSLITSIHLACSFVHLLPQCSKAVWKPIECTIITRDVWGKADILRNIQALQRKYSFSHLKSCVVLYCRIYSTTQNFKF